MSNGSGGSDWPYEIGFGQSPQQGLDDGTSNATALRQKEPRERDRGYLNDLRSLQCILCLSTVAVEAAHIRYSEGKKFNPGVGQKPHDRFAIPLCHRCHWEQHSRGERLFWREVGLDPLRIASQLYERRGCPEAMLGLIHDLHRKYPDTSDAPF